MMARIRLLSRSWLGSWAAGLSLLPLVIGSMVGAGIFTLPAKLGGASNGAGVLTAWGIAGTGVLMLAGRRRNHAAARPGLTPG